MVPQRAIRVLESVHTCSGEGGGRGQSPEENPKLVSLKIVSPQVRPQKLCLLGVAPAKPTGKPHS